MRAYTITDIGKVRSENQDCVRYVQNTLHNFSVLTLCDGMGGARAGSVASDIAISAFVDRITELLCEKKRRIDLTQQVIEAVGYANEKVFEKAGTNSGYSGMGTTLVAAVLKGRQCCVANVGDSRAYLISGGAISQITSDHSFVEEMVNRGTITREQARNHPRKNVITRALGVEPTVECDVFLPAFKKNDLILLCSDGLSNTITDEEILETTQKTRNLANLGRVLLEKALSRGAPDNVTVGLLKK